MTDTDDHQFSDADIAIVGMALRVPGANDVDQYWANLRDGVESVRPLSDDELRDAGVSDRERSNPRYVAMGAPMDDVKGFDAALFGFSPRDAAIMDPQHRHFIEVSWEALEHAGYDPAGYDGSIGVFGGSGHNAYMAYNLLTNPDLMESVGFFLVRHTSNDKDFLVTRASYLFDLTGPAVNVQTACSTSLVAVHMGAQSLLNGESDMVLAGGVTIDMPLDRGYVHEPGEILSADGHCRAFDARSSGTVFGSGAGVVVLKRLDDAMADGDTIHAVIRSTAINNDGSNKVGYLAPSVDGQAAAVSEAIALADIDPETIGYVECHGTGTEIGDPIEVAALTEAFRAHTDRSGYCAIGSVKTNIGHLDTAAGVASLIKATLALSHEAIPPTVHFEAPNPRIDMESSPFFVNAELRPWPAGDSPRRAGVSSLGVGGTNAHIILEEAPAVPPPADSRPLQLLTLSAKGPTALDAATANLADHLTDSPHLDVADVAHTLRTGRRQLEKRRFAVVADTADAAAVLTGSEPTRLVNGTVEPSDRSVVFLFPGQGAQYAGMGQGLYRSETVFRDCVDECANLLQPTLGLDLRTVLFPDGGTDTALTAWADDQLKQTAITQPALFTIEYAMAQLWMSWGVTPTALIGHSIGEYTAACVAGVLSRSDALDLVAARGRLMQELPAGSMLAIPLSADRVAEYLGDGLSLAAKNGPDFCVVAGPDDTVDVLQAKLEGEDLAVRRLHTSHAFHSAMMDPILAPFAEVVASTKRSDPDIAYVSNVSGTWITNEQIADPHYWSSHIRSTVDFVGGLDTILATDPEAVLLEVGPGRALSTFAKQLEGPHGKMVATSMRPPKSNGAADSDDLAVALRTLGELWTTGALADWAPFTGDETRRRIPLPTYPFQHQDYWVEPGQQIQTTADRTGGLDKLTDVDDWFWEPAWTQTPGPTPRTSDDGPDRWLVFSSDGPLGHSVVERLSQTSDVTVVSKGADYRSGDSRFVIDPADPDHYLQLIRQLAESGQTPDAIAYLWPLDASATLDPAEAEFVSAHVDTFYGPLSLVKALAAEGGDERIEWWTVTARQHAIGGDPTVDPTQALTLGPTLVVGREQPTMAAGSLDVGELATLEREANVDAAALMIVAEFRAGVNDAIVAHRGRSRWVRRHMPAPLPTEEATGTPITEHGVYLITGGLGGIGLALAEHLATTAKARPVLVSRTALPERSRWEHIIGSGDDTRLARILSRIVAMESSGTDVMIATADVSDRVAMAAVVEEVLDRFGTIDGAFHAAGQLADGLMATKEPADAGPVLAAKVSGALVLEAALAEVDIDFIALFSSTSAVVGNAGQADYAAANAFLNALANRRTLDSGRRTIAVGWGPWSEVGMTARTAVERGLLDDVERLTPVDHPLLDRWFRGEGATGDVFETDLAPDRHWLLDEHRTRQGTALLPGTGYLDLVRAALSSRHPDRNAAGNTVEMTDVMFLAPFMATGDDDGQRTSIRVSFEPDSGSFVVSSGTTGAEQEHARGHIEYRLSAGDPGRIDIEPIRVRCDKRTTEFVDRYEHEQLAWGPRWNNLRRVDYGDNEALATLALPEQFATDLADHPLHPAVLDLATAGAQDLIVGFSADLDFFVPFSYGRLTHYRPMTEQVYSHIRYRTPTDQDTAVFDITIVDPDGAILIEIDGFTMRRAAGEIAAATGGADVDVPIDPLLDSVTNGIGTDEGMVALRRVLAAPSAVEVVVTAQDLKALIRRADEEATNEPDGGGTGISHERPDLSTAYVEPTTERQHAIAAIWEDMLGISGVGVHDDFYELGGHSLLVTQLGARVRKLSSAAVPLMALFEASTITQLGAAIDAAEEAASASGETNTPKLAAVSRDGYRIRRGVLGGAPSTENPSVENPSVENPSVKNPSVKNKEDA